MDEELPPENQPLPSMFALYSKDVHNLRNVQDEKRLSYLHTLEPELKEAFIESWLWLPIAITCSVCRNSPVFAPYLMDLIQEGNVGLLRCIDAVPSHESTFDTLDGFRKFASKWIRGTIYHYFSRLSDVYVPASSARRKKEDVYSAEEIFNILHPASLEVLFADTYFDIPLPPPLVRDESQRKKINVLLSSLTTKEQKVLRLYYGLDSECHTFNEVGKMLGRSRQYVMVVHSRAIRKLMV